MEFGALTLSQKYFEQQMNSTFGNVGAGNASNAKNFLGFDLSKPITMQNIEASGTNVDVLGLDPSKPITMQNIEKIGASTEFAGANAYGMEGMSGCDVFQRTTNPQETDKVSSTANPTAEGNNEAQAKDGDKKAEGVDAKKKANQANQQQKAGMNAAGQNNNAQRTAGAGASYGAAKALDDADESDETKKASAKKDTDEVSASADEKDSQLQELKEAVGLDNDATESDVKNKLQSMSPEEIAKLGDDMLQKAEELGLISEEELKKKTGSELGDGNPDEAQAAMAAGGSSNTDAE